MERLKFNDFAEFGSYMYELACEEALSTTAVLFYEDVIKLIKWLLQYDDITVGSINIENEDCGYAKEFCITLGSDLVLNVFPAYKIGSKKPEGEYSLPNSDVTFYIGDVNSKAVLQNTYGNKYELIIRNYAYEDTCVDFCKDCCLDCSNCPHKETSRTVSNVLETLEYIFNHL